MRIESGPPIPIFPKKQEIEPIKPIEPSPSLTPEGKGKREQEKKEERKKALAAKEEQDKFQVEMIKKQSGLGTKFDKKS